MDGITAEMIKLGGAESVRWFKSLFDAIWHGRGPRGLEEPVTNSTSQERQLP